MFTNSLNYEYHGAQYVRLLVLMRRPGIGSTLFAVSSAICSAALTLADPAFHQLQGMSPTHYPQ